MTVIIVPVIPSSSVRASSGVPWKASGDRAPTLTDDSAAPTARAASTHDPGSTHSDPRTYSLSASRPTMPTSTIRLWPDQPADLFPRKRRPLLATASHLGRPTGEAWIVSGVSTGRRAAAAGEAGSNPRT